MDIQYHMVKIDDREVLCIGGRIVTDEENAGMLWLTSVQGEKLLHIHHLNYRVVTRAEAEAHLKAEHARKKAAGEGPLEVLGLTTGEKIAISPVEDALSKKQFPAWPEPPRNIYNN